MTSPFAVGNSFPYAGMWYRVDNVSDDGTITLKPQGQTTKALKLRGRAEAQAEQMIKRLRARAR